MRNEVIACLGCLEKWKAKHASRSSETPGSSLNTVRLSAFALSLSKGEWASTSSARKANRTVLRPVPDPLFLRLSRNDGLEANDPR